MQRKHLINLTIFNDKNLQQTRTILLLFSCSVLSDSLWPHVLEHARLSCPPLSLGVCSDSCPLSWWWYLTILSSAIPFSFCPQSFLASGSFPVSQLFASGGQSTGASASPTVLPMNIQGWFTLGWTGLISLPSCNAGDPSSIPGSGKSPG